MMKKQANIKDFVLNIKKSSEKERKKVKMALTQLELKN